MNTLWSLALYFIIGISYGNAQISFQNQANLLDVDVAYGFGFLGGGISLFDYNNDGWDDLTISSTDGTDFYFFKNNNGSFEIDPIGIDGGNLQTKQVIWVDYDNDGDYDFFAASDAGNSKLFRNDGNNTFIDITSASGLPDDGVLDTFGASWGDYNNDSYLDVFLSIRDESQSIPNFLYRNNGDGTFSNVTEEAGLQLTGFITFCAAFFDYDNDGYQDIYMANDKYATANILYHNNGDGTFEDVSASSGANLVMGAMSTTIDDYNNDGWLDIYISNDDQVVEDATVGNALLQNNGDGTFTNVAVATGTQFNSVGWGCVFLDADNDGYKDLYVSSSETGQNDILTAAFYQQQDDTTFVRLDDIGMEEDVRTSYANAIGDIDNDGYPEIGVVNDRNEDIFLWKNVSNTTNNYLKIKLEGTASNTMGIGSWIEISINGEKQYNYTLCGEGYLGQNSATEFFGVGDATTIDYVKVSWLSGQVDLIENVAVNQSLTIVEGENPLSTESFDNTIVFKIYPNPAQTVLHITPPTNFEEVNDSKAQIYDITGRLLKTILLQDTTTISVNDLKSGTYILTLTRTDNTVLSHQKFVKL